MTNERDHEHLIETPDEAQFIWEQIVVAIQETKRTDLLQNPTVLDLGGRNGEFAKQLEEQGIRSVSLDKARIETNRGANQVRANAYKMPFPSGSFDIILCNSLFDAYIYNLDYAKLLQEIIRVLKQNGILSIFAPRPLPREMEEHFRLIASEGQGSLTLWVKK